MPEIIPQLITSTPGANELVLEYLRGLDRNQAAAHDTVGSQLRAPQETQTTQRNQGQAQEQGLPIDTMDISDADTHTHMDWEQGRTTSNENMSEGKTDLDTSMGENNNHNDDSMNGGISGTNNNGNNGNNGNPLANNDPNKPQILEARDPMP